MPNTIKHQGIVENISDSHVQVRILQTSACTGCSIKGHCGVADAKEKRIDVRTSDVACFHPGDRVWVVGTLAMGWRAVMLAFVWPFLLVVVSLFVWMAVWNNELLAAALSMFLLLPYYVVLRLNRKWLNKQFSFYILPLEETADPGNNLGDEITVY